MIYLELHEAGALFSGKKRSIKYKKEKVKMSNTKKILALLLALVMVASTLAGCGNTAAPAEEPAPAADAPADAAPAEEAVAAEPGSKPEGYPSGNTVTFICSSSAGSATDVSARAFVDCFKIDGANVVVENISGGQQTVGTTEAVNRPADGMTVVMMAPSGMFGQPAMNPDLAYKLDDLRILANIAPDCYAIVCVKPGSPLSNADDFMEYIQNNEYTYGVPNIGGYANIGFNYALMQLDKVGLGTAVAYDGSQNVLQAVLNGELDFALLDDNFITSYVDSGELTAVMCIGEAESKLVSAPAMSSYGITGLAGVVGIKWLAVRADTPDDICQYLRAQAVAAIESEQYQNFLQTANYGTIDTVYTEEELEVIKNETLEVYKQVLTAIGLA